MRPAPLPAMRRAMRRAASPGRHVLPGPAGAVLALLGLLAAAPAGAATLKPFSELTAPVVRLSDLFDGLHPGEDRPLGPAPAPGARFSVEAPQLTAIAHQFGVEWQAASPSDRAVVERAGRPLGREQLLAVMRPALEAAGAPADAELDLGGFAPPMLPTEGARLDVSQLDYDGASGRFTAMLTATQDGGEPLRLRLAGAVAAMVELPVLLHRAAPGMPIGPSDLQMARVRATLVRGQSVAAPAQAVGMVARRPIPPGQPIALADLARPLAVERGAAVLLELDSAGLTLTAQGQALDGGAAGERVRVLNMGSRAVLFGLVEGSGRVRITPGSAPLSTPARPYAPARSNAFAQMELPR